MTVEITPNVPDFTKTTLGVSLIQYCLTNQGGGDFQMVQKLDGHTALPLVTWRKILMDVTPLNANFPLSMENTFIINAPQQIIHMMVGVLPIKHYSMLIMDLSRCQ
jgi:hypothetical protein